MQQQAESVRSARSSVASADRTSAPRMHTLHPRSLTIHRSQTDNQVLEASPSISDRNTTRSHARSEKIVATHRSHVDILPQIRSGVLSTPQGPLLSTPPALATPQPTLQHSRRLTSVKRIALFPYHLLPSQHTQEYQFTETNDTDLQWESPLSAPVVPTSTNLALKAYASLRTSRTRLQAPFRPRPSSSHSEEIVSRMGETSVPQLFVPVPPCLSKMPSLKHVLDRRGGSLDRNKAKQIHNLTKIANSRASDGSGGSVSRASPSDSTADNSLLKKQASLSSSTIGRSRFFARGLSLLGSVVFEAGKKGYDETSAGTGSASSVVSGGQESVVWRSSPQQPEVVSLESLEDSTHGVARRSQDAAQVNS